MLVLILIHSGIAAYLYLTTHILDLTYTIISQVKTLLLLQKKVLHLKQGN